MVGGFWPFTNIRQMRSRATLEVGKMESMAGKTILVTGGTSGIGRATALGLARQGARLLLVGRSPERGEDTLAALRAAAPDAQATLLLADLASLKEVRALAERVLERAARLDVLVNNAGVVVTKRSNTVDGFEKMFAVNHLAAFLLTGLLLPRLRESCPSRIVNVASEAHRMGPLDLSDLQSERSFGSLKSYGRSKSANILFTYELARRLEGSGITANCLHPGAIASRLGRGNGVLLDGVQRIAGLFMKSPQQGARTSIYLASSPEVASLSGRYFVKCRERRSATPTHDREAARQLWRDSEELTGITYL